MKRANENPISRSEASTIQNKEILSSNFSRQARIEDTRSERLLSLECSQIIWKAVFFLREDDLSKRDVIEKEFRTLCRVSRTWSIMLQELVKAYFRKRKYSRWVLSYFRDIEFLHFSEFNNVLINTTIENAINTKFNLPDKRKKRSILDRSTTKFNNDSNEWEIFDASIKFLQSLVSLNLISNTKVIEYTGTTKSNLCHLSLLQIEGPSVLLDSRAYSICEMINLTSLSITRNPKNQKKGEYEFIKDLINLRELRLQNCTFIGYESISHLTGLRILGIRGKCNIQNDELKCMTSLNALDITSNLKISNEGVKSLTNLTSLHFGMTNEIDDDGIKMLLYLRDLVASHRISEKGVQHLTRIQSLRFDRFVPVV